MTQWLALKVHFCLSTVAGPVTFFHPTRGYFTLQSSCQRMFRIPRAYILSRRLLGVLKRTRIAPGPWMCHVLGRGLLCPESQHVLLLSSDAGNPSAFFSGPPLKGP